MSDFLEYLFNSCIFIASICLIAYSFSAFKKDSLEKVASNEVIRQAIADPCVKNELAAVINKNQSSIRYEDIKGAQEKCIAVKQKSLFKD